MRILISLFIVLFLTSCETTPNKELSVSQLPKETIEKPDKANIYFVRPMKFTNALLDADISVAENFVGKMVNNSKAKVFIDKGIHQIVAETKHSTDIIIRSMKLKKRFSTRFENGKNYYFEIKALTFYRFQIKPISRKRYLQLSQKIESKESFAKTIRSLEKPTQTILESISESKKQKRQAKKIKGHIVQHEML